MQFAIIAYNDKDNGLKKRLAVRDQHILTGE
jgi:hypothetical protein